MDVHGLIPAIKGADEWVRWVSALAVLAVCSGVLLGLRAVLLRRLQRLAATSETRIDDALAEMLKRTHPLSAVALSLFVAFAVVEVAPRVERIGRPVAMLVLLVQVGFWGSILLRELIERKFVSPQSMLEDPGRAAVARMGVLAGRVALWSLLVLLALANVGVNISALVAGLGVGGIAIALATQNILGDLFASFSILLDKPFVPGDFVIVGDFMGTVEQIGVKTTRVRSLGGEQLIFANSDLLQSRLRNYKRMNERRVLFKLGVVYQTPAQKLRQIPALLRQIVESNEHTRFDRAHFVAYGDFSLNFEIVYYVLDSDYNRYMDIQQRINFDIFERFSAEKIEFAYPTQTLLVQANQSPPPPLSRAPMPPVAPSSRAR